jgi:lipopolysaccharide assembly protein A
MRMINFIILVVAILLGVTFACLNAQQVSIYYYMGKTDLPLSLLLVLTFVIGAFIGLSVGLMMFLRQKGENYRLKSRIRIAEKEVANLRTIPLKNDR